VKIAAFTRRMAVNLGGEPLSNDTPGQSATASCDETMIRLGTTRAVIAFGPWAFKLARARRGVRCNEHEADLFHRNKDKAHRRPLLCRVLWCSRPAIILVMRRAKTPITQAQLEELKSLETGAFRKWDYSGQGDDCCPFEWKPDDWGMVNGKIVAVDYAATAAI
jgi:hypothetical protein